MKTVNVGVIGGGLMGKEVASAFGRWFMLTDQSTRPVLTAVADVNPGALDWFRRVGTIALLTTDYRELLRDSSVDVVYVAVPHDLHEEVYSSVLNAGKDLLAEKPFGIDLAAAKRIVDLAEETRRFVRCSSEFPFYPGAQAVSKRLSQLDRLGTLLEVNCAFLHSSDINFDKPINWKRQVSTCGEPGVMNDLGLHVCHLPLRSGLRPESVYAQLQNVVRERPDGKGGVVPCDTWDNATLHCMLENEVPLRLEMKRLAPGETNTWKIEVIGTRQSVRYSTKHPKTLWTAEGNNWTTVDLGHGCDFEVATGAIFEFGFPDALLQMWASFFSERDDRLAGRFGCATPQEALDSHRLWEAALRSQRSKRAEQLPD